MINRAKPWVYHQARAAAAVGLRGRPPWRPTHGVLRRTAAR
jgi:hypothetical protein